MSRWRVAGWLALGALGCAGSQGTKPHDMSAARHRAAAGTEQAEAARHARRYDPAPPTCTRGGWDQGLESFGVCWTSTDNPTSQHQADAALHRALAEKHRAAAESLRDAEAAACAGIAEGDRVTSPFYHREDIVGAQKVEATVKRDGAQTTQLAGAKVVFRAVPGLTAQRLQGLVDCHMARAAALGHVVPGTEYCPLMLKGIRALVSSTKEGVALQVVSDDPATAEEIVHRVLPRKPDPPVHGRDASAQKR